MATLTSTAAVLTRTSPPRYFHLLWDEDLDELREVLTAVRDRRSEVVTVWHRLYELHFGDRRALLEHQFREIFEEPLLHNQNALLRKDMDAYARGVFRLGEKLADNHVPLQEVIASLHLFEEAALGVFPSDPPLPTHVYTKFDKLSHVRIILMVDAYARSQWSAVTNRIHTLELEAKTLPIEERTRFHGLVGKAPALRELYRRIEAVGQARAVALIVGESGTGKELIARAIHECGGDPNAPFVPLNCAALPKELIESELFGYKRGAFSGANVEYLGLFRAAEGGTLFLDEITEMSPETQSKLLRAIQERKVRPVGSSSEIPIDVRVVASTNRDPKQAIAELQFREDLYYRLQASILHVSPLRERRDDIPLLIDHFVNFFNEKQLRLQSVTGIDSDALSAMQNYAWPGNVRELSNAIEGAFIFGRSPIIDMASLPAEISKNPAPSNNYRVASMPIGSFADAERDIIARALDMASGNKVHAAKTLRISRKRLYAKIERYGLT
jgi:transcriptional regulator with PAS, ATPase and Fis domain